MAERNVVMYMRVPCFIICASSLSLAWHLAKSVCLCVQDNGTITVVGLIDFEVVTSLHLWIEARDKAPTPLSAYQKLIVTVLDENDNRPRFVSPFYETSLFENQPLGTSVLQVCCLAV